MELFVLHSVKVKRKRKQVKTSHGKVFIKKNWKAEKEKLTPVAWNYKIL